ncbi:MAG TPA: hypothetical protein VGQ44_11560 [Gemmatimonadaceae bacterium]|jgi:hypothetical protein|nr:hypothetical protein [Gemmatimonadaceae bacterium]
MSRAKVVKKTNDPVTTAAATAARPSASRRLMIAPPKRDRGSIALSLVIHAFVIVAIASITFRYPLSSLFNSDRDKTPVERIQYVRSVPAAAPSGAVGNGAQEKRTLKRIPTPAQLLPPSTIPTSIPPLPPPTASPGAISGTPNGTGGAPNGIATGIEPALPDPRIELRPNGLRLPLTMAQKNDSAVKAIYVAFRQAEIEAEEHRGRSPRDWTMTHDGQKYGLDSQYIYLGKFKLPSAILAALPLNRGGVDGSRIIEARNANWIQQDIYSHAQGMSEDDFRAAVKRIRERMDRERKDAADTKATQSPIIP